LLGRLLGHGGLVDADAGFGRERVGVEVLKLSDGMLLCLGQIRGRCDSRVQREAPSGRRQLVVGP
jgi:hypothetical protein